MSRRQRARSLSRIHPANHLVTRLALSRFFEERNAPQDVADLFRSLYLLFGSKNRTCGGEYLYKTTNVVWIELRFLLGALNALDRLGNGRHMR